LRFAPNFLQRQAVVVRYMESCGHGPLLVEAVKFGWRRWLLSLLSVDFLEGGNIPKAAVDRSGVVRFAWAIDSVRFGGGNRSIVSADKQLSLTPCRNLVRANFGFLNGRDEELLEVGTA
jgi:hypothetical protein